MMAGVYDQSTINNGNVTYFEVFTLYLAALVLFAAFFATLYTLLWTYRFGFLQAYKIEEQNLLEEFRRVKNITGDSSDEEDIDKKLNEFVIKNKEKIGNVRDRRETMNKSIALIRAEDKAEDSDDD